MKYDAKAIEEMIEAYLPEETGHQKTVLAAMNYAVKAGGKRLRPMMLRLCYEMFAKEPQEALVRPFMAAMEMIHTYSLVHDDLPAMDNDALRRGLPTVHVKFGEDMAILAGDALLNFAFETACQGFAVKPGDANVEKAFAVLAKKAGIYGMVGGQAIDLESEGQRISMPQLRKMHMGKTGALFRAAIRSGAILAEAHPVELSALTVYAERFGLAFQITDDILDVEGDAANIGKPVGSDERNHKSTYVTLTSLEEAHRLAGQAVEEAMEALTIFDDKADFLRELVKSLLTRNK